jgi:hypothetical protein
MVSGTFLTCTILNNVVLYFLNDLNTTEGLGMPKFDVQVAITELEGSIRAEFPAWKPPHDYMNIDGPLYAQRYKGAVGPGTSMTRREAAQHALWLLNWARACASAEDMESASLSIGTASGLVFPFGILAGYRLDPETIYPAVNAPSRWRPH